MGKRELLLIVGFVLVGVVVYQLTAPAAQPGQGFSWSRMVEGLRREIRGHRAHAEVASSQTVPLEKDVTELRFETASARLTVTGEKRHDIACELSVRSNGYDEAEARTYAGRTRLRLTRSADSLLVKIEYPPEATQWATLVMRVPEHLTVRVQPNRSRLELTNLAAVEVAEARGQATITRIRGRVSVTHRGGELTIEDVGPVRLNGRGSDVRLSRVAGEAMLQLQAGELRADALAGPVEIEATSAELRLDKLDATQGPLRINTVAGSLSMRGLTTDARIDVRNTESDIMIDRAAPIAVYSEGDEDLEVTLPTGGFQLDAFVTRGRLTLPEDLRRQVGAPAAAENGEQRATGPVNGGGPTITLRANRGNIVIRSRSGTDSAH